MEYVLQVEYNKTTDEQYVILPEELLSKLRWKEGDKIEWVINKDGSFTLKKKGKRKK